MSFVSGFGAMFNQAWDVVPRRMRGQRDPINGVVNEINWRSAQAC